MAKGLRSTGSASKGSASKKARAQPAKRAPAPAPAPSGRTPRKVARPAALPAAQSKHRTGHDAKSASRPPGPRAPEPKAPRPADARANRPRREDDKGAASKAAARRPPVGAKVAAKPDRVKAGAKGRPAAGKSAAAPSERTANVLKKLQAVAARKAAAKAALAERIRLQGPRRIVIGPGGVRRLVRGAPPVATPESEAKRPRSPYTKSQLEGLRAALLEKRDKLVGDLRSLESQALHASGQDTSANHMADYGSDAYEQDFTLGLIENDETVVKQIHLALQRMEQGEYGLCQQCDQPIPLPRLEFIPWTPYCVGCQENNEKW